jgi:energy-coupling factor transporter ATP-binding protein EcfA2
LVSNSVLVVENLSFGYSGGHQVLREVSFTVSEGEKVALLGPNGAGKSTLLLHLNGIQEGTGTITVAGETLNKTTLARVRGNIGLVFQNPDDQLFCPTVAEDVGFGPRCHGASSEELRAEVARALSAVGLEALGGRFPQHLSGGEKKRAALATVLSMRPKLLALDEPVAGLDARARRSVIEILKSLPQAMLVATHDLEFARELFVRALILDQGRVVFDGPLNEAMGDQGLLERYGLMA